MTSLTSTMFDAIDYLVSTSQTAWATDQTAHVFDGPTPAGFGQEFQNKIWIGADPTQEDASGFEIVAGDQDAATLSQGRSRDESFAIACAIEHWDGGTDLKAARTAVKGYFRTFELFLRGIPPTGPGDVTLGGALGGAGWAHIKGGQALHQQQLTTGCVALLTFHVTCRARLTT